MISAVYRGILMMANNKRDKFSYRLYMKIKFQYLVKLKKKNMSW